jgi:hypothetical protein
MRRNEQARYSAVSAQITQLLDAAAQSGPYNGIINLGRAWLAAELYWRNEQSHMAYEARVGLVIALEERIRRLK